MNDIPTFSPPAPTFTPPTQGYVRSCYYHSNEQAVARCAKCGKPLCQDCAETYQVNDDTYGGQPLCYDCCKELVAANVRDLKKNKRKIKIQFILSLIGMIAGFLLSFVPIIATGEVAMAFVVGLFFAAYGACFFSFIKFYFTSLWQGLKAVVSALFDGDWVGALVAYFTFAIRIFIGFFQCLFYSVKNMIYHKKYIKETAGFIESDTRALQQMEEYMEYTLIRNQNVGVDLATLMQGNSRLANNSFAQSVMANGADAAEADIRRCVTSINENGEIIRGFVA